MLTIFLDTNIIFNERFFQSDFTKVFLKIAKFLDIRVIIPEIVVDETKANFALSLKKEFNAYKKNHIKLGRLIKLDNLKITLDKEIARYNKFFDNLLIEYGVIILPYPEIPAKELVSKSYEAKKPFKNNGKGEGYKDYVIWQTIKNYCVADFKMTVDFDPAELYFFITNNKNDFCGEETDGFVSLHPDLVSDLAANFNHDQGIPSVILSLRDFFDATLQPISEMVSWADIDKPKMLKTAEGILQDSLPYSDVNNFKGLPFIDGVTISNLLKIHPIKDIGLSQVYEDNIIVNTKGMVSIEVKGFMDELSYYFCSDKDVRLIKKEIRDCAEVSKCIDTPFELTMIYSKKDKKVTAHTINFPEELRHVFS